MMLVYGIDNSIQLSLLKKLKKAVKKVVEIENDLNTFGTFQKLQVPISLNIFLLGFQRNNSTASIQREKLL